MMETKICTKCGKELDINMFSKKKALKDGHRGQCKICLSKVGKIYRENNKEIISDKKRINREVNRVALSEYRKQYYEENKIVILKQQYQNNKLHSETIAQYKREYWKTNKEHLTIKRKIWGEDNKESVAEYCKIYGKKWRNNNKKQCVIQSQRYLARKRKLPHTLTVAQWNLAKLHFDNKCAYCGRELPLAQEHFLALTKGGEYTTNNIIPSCKSCNSHKSAKDFFTWYKTYEFYTKTRESKILKFLNYKGNVQQLKIM